MLKMRLPLLLLPAARMATATPLADSIRAFDIGHLFGRSDCANPCGWKGQLCCSSSQYCYTDSSDQAQCGEITASAAAGGGYWTMWTSTYTQTDLVTMTTVGSSYVPSPSAAAPAATATAVCNYSLDETPCGIICCASNQYCKASGQCAAAANPDSSGIYASSWSASTTTAGFSAPLRPTASTLVTITSGAGAAASTTEPFLTPVATGLNATLVKADTSHGLSGGAIAGIVLGTLLAVAILFCLCFFLCIRGLLDGLAALLGFGRRRTRERETVIVEEHRHRSGRTGDTVYTGRPSRVERRSGVASRRHSNSGAKEAVGIAGALAGLAAVLGYKRRQDRKREVEREKQTRVVEQAEAVSQITSDSSESSYVQQERRHETYVREAERARSHGRYGGTVRSASRR